MPTKEELISLLGYNTYQILEELCNYIENNYEMDKLWNNGGKYGLHELKYRRGGKTLCTVYIREKCFGYWIIFGKEERDKFENQRDDFSFSMRKIYDDTQVYHDGKWIMLDINDGSLVEDIKKMLYIKKRPNKRIKQA